MKIKLSELAGLVGGTLKGDGSAVITGAAGLEEAGSSDITFLGNQKYLQLVSSTLAGAVIVPDNFEAQAKTPLVIAKNPQLAFAKVLVLIDKERLALVKPGIHALSQIAKNASIGSSVHIGPFVVIEEGAVIGKGTVITSHCYIGKNSRIGINSLLYPNVTIRENITVGKNAIIHPGTVIGSDGFGFIPLGKSNFKIPQIGTVEIGDDVEIGANCAIDRATTGATRIGNGTKLDNLVHIAHNIQIGENCCIAGQVGFAGSTKLGNNVMIAGQAGINGHISIGNGVVIGGKAVVIGDVPDNTMISGYPARPHRENLKIQALVGRLPEFFEELKEIRKQLSGPK